MQSNPAQFHETSLPRSDTHGARKYRLDFEAGALPPLYDFWSVSIHRTPSHAKWSECYSVGDWCEALAYEADGSLRLYMQHTPPASGSSNWIPTPSGPYSAELRIYELPAGREGTVHTFTLSSSEGDWVGVVQGVRANAITRWARLKANGILSTLNTVRSKWRGKLPAAEGIEQYTAWGSLDDLQIDHALLRNIKASLSLHESVADG